MIFSYGQYISLMRKVAGNGLGGTVEPLHCQGHFRDPRSDMAVLVIFMTKMVMGGDFY